ncbi:BTAD domain-containing putative transcriptional regulator [Desulfurivibrio sp. D14AmB]|uniref:BTAD domain-containing putative transcriptional regulator n=1 Tax=Desulfurivibrio sp. D14AmB TaxID=3374370 RepID=UPI00376F2AC1
MALVSDHRIVTLKQALEMIPEEVVRAYPWYSYLTGVVCLDFSPPEALSWFERSRELFAAVADPFGELLAMAQMIAFRMLVDGMYNEGELLLGRAEELFASQREALPAAIAIQTAQILAGGNCFFLCKMEKAAFYSSLGLQLAGEHGMENLVAGLRVMRCYENGLGRWAAYHSEVEQALPLFVSPRVSAINKLLLRIAAVNLLDMEGDFGSYQYHKERFERETSGDLLAKSIAAPFLLIWDIDLLVAGGRNEEAIRLARQGLTLPHGGANPHLRSQFLHYLAFLLAACGDYKEAAATAEESIRLRDIAGGALFRTLNLFIIGGAHALMGDAEQAENLLNQSISSAVDHNRFMLIGAHVHRAYNRLRTGREVDSLTDIRIALKYLRENRFVHFFCWSPLIMKEILALAVRENIEPKYARHLATERLGSAILPDGRMIPLLEIKSLGTLELSISGAGRISAWDLTPAQRQLLALLITSPGSSLAQEQAQCILWPESSPEKSRSKLDNLLSRLRKLLAAAFEPHSVQDYLVLEKGILRLKHCVIDAKQFVCYGEKGLAHVRRREFWQADNAFRTANGFWQGEYLPGLDPDDAVSARREELSRLRVTISRPWSDILVGSNRAPEAADLLTATLRLDPLNQTLVRNLYNLRTIAGDLPGARKSLRQYRQGLAKEGFPPEEIEEMLESFWGQHSRFK